MAYMGKTIRKTCKRWNGPWDAHGLTFSCFHHHPFLINDRVRKYFIKAIETARQKYSFHIWAYVIMPEHIHLLIWPTKEQYSISNILKSIKQSVSRKTVNWLKINDKAGLKFLATGQSDKPYQFWQDGGGYDRNVRNTEALKKMLEYIHENPVTRGLVNRPEDWLWSSAQDWLDLRQGPIQIDKESYENTFT